jgi:hypothetical protein
MLTAWDEQDDAERTCVGRGDLSAGVMITMPRHLSRSETFTGKTCSGTGCGPWFIQQDIIPTSHRVVRKKCWFGSSFHRRENAAKRTLSS